MSINISRDSQKSINVNNGINESNINFTRTIEQNNSGSNGNFDDGLKYIMNIDAKSKTIEDEQNHQNDTFQEENEEIRSEYSLSDEIDDNLDEVPRMSYEELEKEKAKYLSKLKTIRHEGVIGTIAFDEVGDVLNAPVTLNSYGPKGKFPVKVVN